MILQLGKKLRETNCDLSSLETSPLQDLEMDCRPWKDLFAVEGFTFGTVSFVLTETDHIVRILVQDRLLED